MCKALGFQLNSALPNPNSKDFFEFLLTIVTNLRLNYEQDISVRQRGF